MFYWRYMYVLQLTSIVTLLKYGTFFTSDLKATEDSHFHVAMATM